MARTLRQRVLSYYPVLLLVSLRKRTAERRGPIRIVDNQLDLRILLQL